MKRWNKTILRLISSGVVLLMAEQQILYPVATGALLLLAAQTALATNVPVTPPTPGPTVPPPSTAPGSPKDGDGGATSSDGGTGTTSAADCPCPPCSGSGSDTTGSPSGDPVDLGRGRSFIGDAEIGPIPTHGGLPNATLAFNRFYSSTVTNSGPLGIGWTHNYNVTLSFVDDGWYAIIRGWDSKEVVFTKHDSGHWVLVGQGWVWYPGEITYLPPSGETSTLSMVGGNFIWQLQHGTRFTFDAAQGYRLASITDRNGNSVNLSYNTQGRFGTVTDSAGRQLTFIYNTDGTIYQVSDPLVRTETYSYTNGRLTGVSDSLGTKVSYAYDDPNHPNAITRVTDGRNNVLRYTYDTGGRVIAETNKVGAAQTYAYDPVSHATTVTNFNGVLGYTDRFDTNAWLLTYTDSAGTITYNRNSQTGWLNSFADRMGYTTAFQRDGSGNMLRSVDPLGRTNSWTYGAYSLPITHRNAAGGVTTWNRDSHGNVLAVTNATGQVTVYQYTGADRTSMTDANNHTVQIAYDQYGNRTNITDALNHSTGFGYDIVGRLTSHTDALGRTGSLAWDNRDRLVRVVNAAGETNSLVRDGNGNVTAWTNALGYVRTYGYDAEDRLTSVTLPSGASAFVSLGYDKMGNRTNITDALGHKISFGYDSANRLTSVTNALEKTWTLTPNANGWYTRTIDPNSHTNSLVYDAAGQVTAWTNALGQVAAFGYDKLGNLGTVTDARNNSMQFDYAPCCQNRLLSITYADTTTEQFAYDGVKHVTNYVNRAGQTVALTYDAANRLTQKAYFENGSATVSVAAVEFSYDAANQLTGVVAAVTGGPVSSALAFQYYAAGRLTNEVQTVGQALPLAVGYQYYTDGRRKQLTYPDGTFITYEYSTNGWLTAIKDGGTNTIVSYEYDAAGRRTKRTLENSTFTVYDYDNADQMTNIWHRQVAGNVTNTISQYGYGYDNAGNRKFMKRASGKGDVYRYDAADQLTNVLYNATNPDATPSAWSNETRYAFDSAGNRTGVVAAVTGGNTNSTIYVPNNLNLYASVGATNLSYDSKGNLTSDGVWTYAYDYENRLASATNSGAGVPPVSITYAYDAFGRLIERQTSGASQSTNRFYYAGWQSVAEYNGAGALQAKYVYGPGIDEPIRTTHYSPVTTQYYFHTDALGSITEITSSSGVLTEQYRYDVYGQPTIYDSSFIRHPSSLVGNRLLFTGRDRDPDTGLYNFRYRYYSPTLGRFVQADKINIGGGDLNLYRYAGNNPVNQSDPLGLFWSWAGAALGAVAGAVGGATAYLVEHAITGAPITGSGFAAAVGAGAFTGFAAAAVVMAFTGDPSAAFAAVAIGSSVFYPGTAAVVTIGTTAAIGAAGGAITGAIEGPSGGGSASGAALPTPPDSGYIPTPSPPTPAEPCP